VSVSATLSYWLLVHTVSGAHTRSVVSVGAAVWYSSAVQTLVVAHWRSPVAVGATFSNSKPLHTLRSVHTRCRCPLAAVETYCVVRSQVMCAVQPRSLVGVGAVDSYSVPATWFPAIQLVLTHSVQAGQALPLSQ
jgi:hypothetical protein